MSIRLHGIPILQPIPLTNDPCGPMGSPQPILQLKELSVDHVRWQQWRTMLTRDNLKRAVDGLGNKE